VLEEPDVDGSERKKNCLLETLIIIINGNKNTEGKIQVT
jgi:hypothetical protein